MYNSASEVVREALRLMIQRQAGDDNQKVRSHIQAGLDELAEGQFTEGTAEELFQQAISRSRQRVVGGNSGALAS
jgi:putative addiction module CopG family antidote